MPPQKTTDILKAYYVMSFHTKFQIKIQTIFQDIGNLVFLVMLKIWPFLTPQKHVFGYNFWTKIDTHMRFFVPAQKIIVDSF